MAKRNSIKGTITDNKAPMPGRDGATAIIEAITHAEDGTTFSSPPSPQLRKTLSTRNARYSDELLEFLLKEAEQRGGAIGDVTVNVEYGQSVLDFVHAYEPAIVKLREIVQRYEDEVLLRRNGLINTAVVAMAGVDRHAKVDPSYLPLAQSLARLRPIWSRKPKAANDGNTNSTDSTKASDSSSTAPTTAPPTETTVHPASVFVTANAPATNAPSNGAAAGREVAPTNSH